MRATAAIFLIFALAHAWGFNHAKSTFREDRAARVEQSCLSPANTSIRGGEQSSGRDLPGLPAGSWYGGAEAAPIVPEGTQGLQAAPVVCGPAGCYSTPQSVTAVY